MSEELVEVVYCCSKRTGEDSTTFGKVLLRLRGGDKAFDCFLLFGTRFILAMKIKSNLFVSSVRFVKESRILCYKNVCILSSTNKTPSITS